MQRYDANIDIKLHESRPIAVFLLLNLDIVR